MQRLAVLGVSRLTTVSVPQSDRASDNVRNSKIVMGRFGFFHQKNQNAAGNVRRRFYYYCD